MSTKFHNGYRLAVNTDLFAFTEKLREVMGPVRDQLDAAWLMDHAVRAVHKADTQGDQRPQMPLADAMFAWDEEQDKINAKGHRQAELDRGFNPHRFEVAFGRDETSGRILALLYTERSEFRAAWEQLDEVEDWHYQNSTDRPSHISEGEWDERRASWDRILGDAAPVDRMVTFKLRASLYDIGMIRLTSGRDKHRDLLAAAAPSKRKVASDIAFKLIMAEHCRRTGYDADTGADADDSAQRARQDRLIRDVWTLMREDQSSVTDAVEPLLADDVVSYILDSSLTDPPTTRPVDLTAAREAAAAWCARRRELDEDD